MNLIGAWRRRQRHRELLYGPKVLLPGGPEQWIEDSLDWLIGRFGVEPLRRRPVLPSEFVPVGYDGSECAARELCLQVCAWMEVPDDRIRFSFRMEQVRAAARSAAVHRLNTEKGSDLIAISGLQATMTAAEVDALAAAGFAPEIGVLAERELQAEVKRCTAILQETDLNRRAELCQRAQAIWSTPAGSGSRAAWLDLRTGGLEGSAVMLSATTLADPAAVVTATAHELGHEVLWGYHLIDRSRPDAEALTDLFAVFHGFGIFLANQAVERVPGRRSALQTLGYLGERGASDALAAYCFRRHLLFPESILPVMPTEVDRAVRIRTFARLASLVKDAEIASIQEGAPLT
ncbi:hypothetical protein EV649_3159 [Kribbella sp. VKM Ac-2569]|uniref:hypothetical protein n=1 Tax=Kribbella sp. VKM Ac-2569 TaxID=2512220 RepID=UPI00102CDEFC|nr:hypothetical protein [Kribbella sp. VKM Ac-2569]RZT20019.1 hypothetical protein EV649_3159 [Kribbella sp. VKM Ac-2569]